VPAALYALSNVSSIDLRSNKIGLSAETPAHKKQLAAWIDGGVLQMDSNVLSALASSIDSERSSVVGTAKAADDGSAGAQIEADPPSESSSGSEESIASTQDSGGMDVIPVTIMSVVIPAILAVGVTLAFILRKRRRMQDRETDGILDLPHPFDKSSSGRFETSGNFTAVESEFSRSRMSSGSHRQDDNEHGSCVGLAVTPTDATQQQGASTSANVGYVNLESPHEAHQNRQSSNRDDGDSSHSLELLGTQSTASVTSVQTRATARTALRSALETLLTTQSTDPLSVNANQYAFNPGTRIEETPVAFFVDCYLSSRKSEGPAPPAKLVLKFFIEEDADLAGRESYALSCLQHDEAARAFAPWLVDDALEYELDLTSNAVKLSCCVLVLEKPNCMTLRAHVATSREPVEHQVACAVSALRALHGRGLVHGALHTDSLVACAPDSHLKFWGLECASRAGHKVPCPDDDLLSVAQAECVAPELATLTLEHNASLRASSSLDVWSLGVIILKMQAPGRHLEEFKGYTTGREVFERLTSDLDGELSSSCFFERSIASFVSSDDVKDLLRLCLQRTPTLRPSADFISKHKAFQSREREVSRVTTVRSAAVPRLLSAIIEEKDVAPQAAEPEREASGKDQLEKLLDDVAPEPLPPSLWLFLPPSELEIDFTQRAGLYSKEQWVAKLKQLQQQQALELRFPLVFMCETCESSAAVPCSNATTTKYGTSVPSSLLPLVMPLVRETMLFLEARTILSNGSSVGEVSGLASPQQWEELRTFYSALEGMELATLNPVNELELAPMEQQLQSRDPAKAQLVLDQLSQLIFSEEKREYVRNLLDALVSEEPFVAPAERSSWAALRRFDVSSVTTSQTRWLCSHHAPRIDSQCVE
jgi:serine/threonine protein kinase